MKLLVTGGAGFIGSAFVRHAMKRWPAASIVVLDKLTYAGNRANLESVNSDSRFEFIQGDICDLEMVRTAISGCTHVTNFAAETHVDRSILDPGAFIRTDIEGTRVLLEAARSESVERFLQVSTDEVYGHIEPPLKAKETDPLRPRSPYAASKAGGDLMVEAFHVTYGVPTLITRGSNTYGPNQFPEKLIPLFITNALDGKPLPVYGDGRQIRDWLWVEDHCSGIGTVLESGTVGTVYNLGAGNERTNMDVVLGILNQLGAGDSLLRYVADRPGHDRRYALDSSRAASLGWSPSIQLNEGLVRTVEWYRQNERWWRPLKGEAFQDYYQLQYEDRISQGTPAR